MAALRSEMSVCLVMVKCHGDFVAGIDSHLNIKYSPKTKGCQGEHTTLSSL